MPALVQYAYDAFIGDSVASMDRLPAYLPAQGYDRRFYAQYYSNAFDGTAVNSWPSRAGNRETALTPGGSAVSGATAPVMGTVGKERVVRFNGTTDALGQLYVNNEPYTFTLAFYLPEAKANTWLVSTGDDGQRGLFTSPTSNVSFYGKGRVVGAALGPGWHVLTVRADAENTSIRLDGSAVFTYVAGYDGERNRLNLAGSRFNPSRGRMDVVELVHWPRALTDAEIASIHTALADRYGI